MIDDKDFLKPSDQSVIENPAKNESDRMLSWGEILHKEALSLLARYLPDALPQEPTEILFSLFPGYRGKFKGRHYIAAEEYPTSTQDMEIMDQRIKHIGDKDYVQPPKKPEDWEEPERLLKGHNEYSTDSWRGVYVLVHELIHQRQAELNPKSNYTLSSPELDNIDPDSMNSDELHGLLTQAHKEQVKTMDANSLFYPVVEGMAALGSYYVMGRLADDLMKAGEKDVADKIQKLRKHRLRWEVVKPKIEAINGRPIGSYDLHYSNGLKIMRKLYRRFGIENTPKLLRDVDLSACRGISEGSPEYQQIIENPELLPGLHQTK